MSISRRSFLKRSAATAAVTAAGGALSGVTAKTKADMTPGPGNKWPGRVAFNFNKNAVDENGGVDADVVKAMVDDAIKVLTGESEVGAAWKAVFPDSLTKDSKIAIKTNILNAGKPCPHAASVQAITDGLQLMDLGGDTLAAGNITVYDGNNNSSFSQAGYESSNFGGVNLVKDSHAKFGDGARNDQAYAKTLNEADFLINVFSPRGHFIGGGFTLGFKSHYGTYASPSSMHGGNNAEILCELTATGPVLEKLVLSVCSGIFGMNESHGPTGSPDIFSRYTESIDPDSGTATPSTIILSTDPVSCDMQAVKLMRLNKNGGKYGIDDMPDYLKRAAGLSGSQYNIGVIDEGEMDIREIINGASTGAVTDSAVKAGIGAGTPRLQVSSLKNQNKLFIRYSLPQSQIGADAKIEIYTVKGNRVFSTVRTTVGAVNHFSWNGKTSSGGMIPAGMYVVHVSVGRIALSEKVSITR